MRGRSMQSRGASLTTGSKCVLQFHMRRQKNNLTIDHCYMNERRPVRRRDVRPHWRTDNCRLELNWLEASMFTRLVSQVDVLLQTATSASLLDVTICAWVRVPCDKTTAGVYTRHYHSLVYICLSYVRRRSLWYRYYFSFLSFFLLLLILPLLLTRQWAQDHLTWIAANDWIKRCIGQEGSGLKKNGTRRQMHPASS